MVISQHVSLYMFQGVQVRKKLLCEPRNGSGYILNVCFKFDCKANSLASAEETLQEE